MKQHFVTFWSPGTFVSESTTNPIDSWNTDEAMKMAHRITERHGAKPYCFTFSTRERGDRDLDSRETKTSGKYFLGGRILTLADVKREMPDKTILISNMTFNKIERVCVNQNSYLSCHPFEKGDVLLDFDLKKAASK